MSLYNFVQYTKIIDTEKISKTPTQGRVSFIIIFKYKYIHKSVNLSNIFSRKVIGFLIHHGILEYTKNVVNIIMMSVLIKKLKHQCIDIENST